MERQKVSVTERGLLVAPGQSKKLAEIRKKVQPLVAAENVSLSEKESYAGLKPELVAELKSARKIIDDRINEILCSFPEGKKNKLFGFRFGSIDAVKSMSIKTAFKKLGIDDNSVKLKLIAGMDYHGNQVKGR
ncbi:MAG: hypothetical protein WC685_10025 [Methylobacter sp.]|jgi:hypothetical protein